MDTSEKSELHSMVWKVYGGPRCRSWVLSSGEGQRSSPTIVLEFPRQKKTSPRPACSSSPCALYAVNFFSL